MIREVATLFIKQYGEYRLSTENDSGESIKNSWYFLEFEAKFEKPSDTEEETWGGTHSWKNHEWFAIEDDVYYTFEFFPTA